MHQASSTAAVADEVMQRPCRAVGAKLDGAIQLLDARAGLPLAARRRKFRT